MIFPFDNPRWSAALETRINPHYKNSSRSHWKRNRNRRKSMNPEFILVDRPLEADGPQQRRKKAMREMLVAA